MTSKRSRSCWRDRTPWSAVEGCNSSYRLMWAKTSKKTTGTPWASTWLDSWTTQRWCKTTRPPTTPKEKTLWTIEPTSNVNNPSNPPILIQHKKSMKTHLLNILCRLRNKAIFTGLIVRWLWRRRLSPRHIQSRCQVRSCHRSNISKNPWFKGRTPCRG